MDRPPIERHEEYCRENPGCSEGFGSKTMSTLLAYIRRLEAAIARWDEEAPHCGGAWAARQALYNIAADIPKL